MTEKFFRWLSFGALAFLLLVGIYSIVKPELDYRQTIAQNLVLQAQLQELTQKNQQQTQALAALYGNKEIREQITKFFPAMFQSATPTASNGIVPKR